MTIRIQKHIVPIITSEEMQKIVKMIIAISNNDSLESLEQKCKSGTFLTIEPEPNAIDGGAAEMFAKALCDGVRNLPINQQPPRSR